MPLCFIFHSSGAFQKKMFVAFVEIPSSYLKFLQFCGITKIVFF